MMKMKRCLKKIGNWYIKQTIEYYKPLVENNIPIMF